MIYNNFGATAAILLRNFATGSYTPTAAEFGGDDVLADVLAGAAAQVAQAMPSRLAAMIQHPELQKIEARAAAGQTTATLALGPAVAGKVHIWRGPPSCFMSRPILATDAWGARPLGYGTINTATPPGALCELAETEFTVTGQTVSLVTPLNRNDEVYASYEVDTEDEDFSLPSVADMVAMGAAAAVGAKVYPQASSEWPQVAALADGFATYLADLGAGRLVPAELIRLQWWREPERTTEGGLGSVRRYRT